MIGPQRFTVLGSGQREECADFGRVENLQAELPCRIDP